MIACHAFQTVLFTVCNIILIRVAQWGALSHHSSRVHGSVTQYITQSQCCLDRLQIHLDPDLDKAVTDDE